MGLAGVTGEQFADLHTGSRGVDGAERPGVIGASVGLGVVGFEVAGAADEPDQDDRRGLARGTTCGAIGRLGGGGVTEAVETGEGQTGPSPQPQLEKLPAGRPPAQLRGLAGPGVTPGRRGCQHAAVSRNAALSHGQNRRGAWKVERAEGGNTARNRAGHHRANPEPRGPNPETRNKVRPERDPAEGSLAWGAPLGQPGPWG
jgi:hypothetical protein